MKITFVHHSCFVVELESHILVFDYFDGDKVNGYHFTGQLPEFDPAKKLYFFASHKHQDHFDLGILKLAGKYPDIQYILSKDIRLGRNYLLRNGIPLSVKERIRFVSPDGSYRVDDMKITTLRSTDAGVAFLVEAEGKVIYHAGDLHNWKMEGAGDLINGKMERGYKGALSRISDRHIDVAFVVLDGRLGEHTNRGLDYFMRHMNADYVFPMHMWQQFDLPAQYKRMCNNSLFTERLVDITHENQIFEID